MMHPSMSGNYHDYISVQGMGPLMWEYDKDIRSAVVMTYPKLPSRNELVLMQ